MNNALLKSASRGRLRYYPEQRSALVDAYQSKRPLIDEGHVAVAFAVSDLVDSDGGDTVQIAAFQAKIDDPFYRTADRVPAGMERSGGFLPIQTPGPRRE